MKKNLKQTKEASETKTTCNCCKRSADISISSSRVIRRGGHDHHYKKIGHMQLCCHSNCLVGNVNDKEISSESSSDDSSNNTSESEDSGGSEEEGSGSPGRPYFGWFGDIRPVMRALV